VRDVQDHADTLHLPEQGRPLLEQPALGAGAVGVGADAVVRRTDDPQTGVVPLLQLVGREDGVGPLHAEDEAEVMLARPRLPPCEREIPELASP
jgi:hypothetical protein